MEQRYNELSNKLSEPDIANDQKQFAELMKEFKNLSPIIEKYKEYQSAENLSLIHIYSKQTCKGVKNE